MRAVRCICGGHALISEYRGKVIGIVCDKCRFRIHINSENAESRINQWENAILKWNEEQSRRREERSAEMTEKKLCPMKFTKSVHTQFLDKNGNIKRVECGICNMEFCAWWDAERSCCGAVAIHSK